MTRAERNKRYRQTEKGKENQNKRRQTKKYKEYQKLYRQTEKYKENERNRNQTESRKEYKKIHGQSEEVKEHLRNYRRTEKGRELSRINNQIYRAKKKELPRTLTVSEWKEILESQDNKCNICGISFKEVRATQDHIIPVSKGGAYTKENIQGLCQKCNSSKSNKI